VPEIYFEDFRVGDTAEYGPRTITADEIKAFAAEFDPQPMHLDDEAARAGMLGGLCASGYHTCAMTARLMSEGLLLRSAFLGSPGTEEIRWLAPVRPGDSLTVRTRVLETRSSRSRPDMGLVRMLVEVVVRSRTAMTMTASLMFARRQPA
jgi:acyl dehydratase